jgi:formate hydrogenlyase subunit 3/multisubunit Na+/H+ antiporter MnhD subunit
MLQGVDQLFAGLKNRICILQSHVPSFGECQCAVLADEKRMPEILLKPAQLYAERRLGYVQSRGRLGQPTFVGDGPKIPQVVVVQRHANTYNKQNIKLQNIYLKEPPKLASLTPMSNEISNGRGRGSSAARLSTIFGAVCFLFALGATPFLDRVTSILPLLTTLLFYMVCRYAQRYMRGDPEQGRFAAWLCLTGTCVFALILAQNLLLFALAWSATSLCLHQLLEFYRERPSALLAARKKFLISRLGDAALLGALFLTHRFFDTWNFQRIFAAADRLRAAGLHSLPASVTWICVLLSLAALMKSAQVPFHTWLPDTMETPTPVSALMHAGIINAGGILVIRLSPLLSLSRSALLILTVFGAFTALFASIVMWTQASIKRCLAFSTVGQMGFMMLECGLGAFHLALLHIVAHSLYKAHAFLSSGNAVSTGTRKRSPTLKPLAIVLALGSSVSITLAASRLIGISMADQLVLSGVFVLGLTQMLALLWSSLDEIWLVPLGLALGAGVGALYFLLEKGFALIITPSNGGQSGLSLTVLAGFFLLVLLQTQLTTLSRTQFGRQLYVHARNGFYFNTLANRLTTAVWPFSGAGESV